MKKRLYRSREDIIVSGVCGGIAEYLDIDPTIIRLVWIVLSIFMGAIFGGMIVYIVCSFIMPRTPIYIDAEYTEKD